MYLYTWETILSLFFLGESFVKYETFSSFYSLLNFEGLLSVRFARKLVDLNPWWLFKSCIITTSTLKYDYNPL